MKSNVINSNSELLTHLDKNERLFVLLFNSELEKGICAQKAIEESLNETNKSIVFFSDLKIVRDIHNVYSITSSPSLLIFEKGEFVNAVKGCHDSDFYSSLFENAIYQAQKSDSGVSTKRVTVYSTPTCSWCNTLKSWLRKNAVSYDDIDISKDQRAADDLVRRSGQQGVPQTNINGEIVVGFNQQRLKELLEIV